MSGNKKEQESKTLSNISVSSSLSENVQRFGSANKEHLVILDGIDNETGEELKRSLKGIANYKVTDGQKNIKQQAGFSAELQEQARQNADNIIKGNQNRVVQYDNLSEEQRKQIQNMFPNFKINKGNHELVDLVTLDKNGNVVEVSQMKIVGSNASDCLKKLASKKYQKYLENDIEVKIPKEYHEELQKLADKKIKSIQKQMQRVKDDSEKLKELQKELKKYKKIKAQTKPSTVSSDEAVNARNNPTISTIKDMTKIAHDAGVQGVKFGVGVGGAISLIKNVVCIYKDDKNPKEALQDICIDTSKAGALGYTTSFSGSFISSLMQNSEKEVLRNASKTALPAMIAVACVEVSKSVISYAKGEISGYELAEQLGEKGTGIGVSAMFATAMQIAVPIPAVGAMLGGMIGYTLNSLFYQETMTALKEAQIARERRIEIEKQCEEMIQEIKQYRKEMNELLEKYFSEYLSFFNQNYENMQKALQDDNVDKFICANIELIQKQGKKLQFCNFDEFKKFQNSNDLFEF